MSKKTKRRIDEDFEFRKIKSVEPKNKQKFKRFLEHALDTHDDWEDIEDELSEQDRIRYR
jgi:hypothetical protein